MIEFTIAMPCPRVEIGQAILEALNAFAIPIDATAQTPSPIGS